MQKSELQLQSLVNTKVSVLTNDGKILIGTLLGFDQTTNLILSGTKERIFSLDGTIEDELGLFLLRGNSF